MTPEQLRMARNAVRLGVRELAELADVAPATISRFEGGKGGMQMRSVEALRSALEGLGVQFLAAGDIARAPGVALEDKPN
ncbi:helix-turn-helix domain-containing protein [Lentibacter sp. XHP0401]|uniref:helix-turn-helix domain-containing protein n=1 Tax=Lentibacter sp. XHP0401 TaxID=2984334 RepID=UPI0021E74EC7|nr:helix-turn-helix transcriptional regulator [Lentibacter sp. XHP0401]MCV2894998.1 helix-turn-helix domain-containing protein [Lentibacter sp. XHP0401]